MFDRIAKVALTVAVSLIAFDTISAASGEEVGFKPIFDSKTLTGWDGDPALWRVEDGTITGQTTADRPIKVNTFLIWRQGEVDDFELKLQFRMFGGNSGVQFRSFESPKEWGKWVVGGYQADMDGADEWTGSLYGERYRGILGVRGEKAVIGNDHKPKVIGRVGDRDKLKTLVKKEDWNEYHIIARGNHIVQKINGQVMVDVTDEDKEMQRRSGVVALQLHVGPPMKVQFRDILLKRLPMEDKKKIVFVAGPRSHDYASHEHNAGCLLLARMLNDNMPNVHAAVYRNGWPADPTAFDNADAIVLYADGGGGNMLIPHVDEMDKLMKKGVGLACLHYALDAPKGKAGDHLLRWIGGYFETFWSVNPSWTAEFKKLPEHPITRGVRSFTILDEWYYHMRFADDMAGVTPILTAIPPDQTRKGPDGPYSGNEHVRARMGMPEHVAWAYERPGGGRGFGFTGGHSHWNWGHDDFRKVVLNAIVWVAKADVPANGVPSKTPTLEELEANQDEPQPKDFDREAVRKRLRSWNEASAR
jgi:type 1 glutamine amidotransferase